MSLLSAQCSVTWDPISIIRFITCAGLCRTAVFKAAARNPCSLVFFITLTRKIIQRNSADAGRLGFTFQYTYAKRTPPRLKSSANYKTATGGAVVWAWSVLEELKKIVLVHATFCQAPKLKGRYYNMLTLNVLFVRNLVWICRIF